MDKYFEAHISRNGEKTYRPKDIFASRLTKDLTEIYAKYEEILSRNGWTDFSDMILDAIRLLEENADLRLQLREKFR